MPLSDSPLAPAPQHPALANTSLARHFPRFPRLPHFPGFPPTWHFPRLWKLLKVTTALLVLAALALALVTAWVWRQLPDTAALANYQAKQSLRIETADGVQIGGFGSERRVVLRIDQIPPLMKASLLAVEDARFYGHRGLDPIGIARALVAWLTGGRRQGASTITQQVARTFFLDRSLTAERKFKEALLAFKIESELSKDQILALYMNQIYLGSRAYGFEAAAQTYFGKTLGALSAAECAMLAGLPQNPHFVNPIRNPARAQARQRLVLVRMRTMGVLDEARYQAARAEKLNVRKLNEVDVHGEFVAEMVRQQLFAQFGEEAYTSGLKVTTTLRANEQQAAYIALRRTLIDHALRQPWHGPEGFEPVPDGVIALPVSTTKSNGSKPANASANNDAVPPIDAAQAQAINTALADREDDDDLRLAWVLAASPKAVTALLSTGEQVQIDGVGLRAVQSALNHNAAARLRIRRGAIVRVMRATAQGGGLSLAAANIAAVKPAEIAKNVRPRLSQTLAGTAAGTTTTTTATNTTTTTSLWAIAQWPQAEGALVALDPHNGEIRALVGGFDFRRNQFNHATQGWRQPGSSYKPFLYSAALEAGVQPETLVNDAPLENVGDWDPHNDDDSTDGPTAVRWAFARSKNLVSIRLMQLVGPQAAREWAARFGLEADRQPANLTQALGAGATNPLQLAGAYAVFANGGLRTTPTLILRITRSVNQGSGAGPGAGPGAVATTISGTRPSFSASSSSSQARSSSANANANAIANAKNVKLESVKRGEELIFDTYALPTPSVAPITAATPTTATTAATSATPATAVTDGTVDNPQRAISERNAFIMSTLLQEVTRSGTAAKAQAQLKRTDLYGKTGTTNDVFDAWFAGYHPDLVAVVWVGYDTPASLGSRASGSALALPAWIDFMAVALKNVPVKEIPPPQTVASIGPATEATPGPSAPSASQGVIRLDGEWRFSEWQSGGFIQSLGLDGQVINPSLVIRVPGPAALAAAADAAAVAAAIAATASTAATMAIDSTAKTSATARTGSDALVPAMPTIPTQTPSATNVFGDPTSPRVRSVPPPPPGER